MREEVGRTGRRFAAAFLLAATALASTPATAYHDKTSHVTEYTAHNMSSGEWKIGIWQVGFAPWDWLMVDTWHFPWLLSVSNIGLKARFWHDDTWTVSGRTGIFKLDVAKLTKDENTDMVFKVVPTELAVSQRLSPDWELSLAGIYTGVVASGSADENEVEGAAGESNVQAVFTLEWRWSHKWAMLLRTRHLLSVQVSGKGSTTTDVGDDGFTTMTFHGNAGTSDVADLGFPETFSIVPSLAYSSEVFNVEFGLGYGNMNLPGINFPVPVKTWIPTFDMFWRW